MRSSEISRNHSPVVKHRVLPIIGFRHKSSSNVFYAKSDYQFKSTSRLVQSIHSISKIRQRINNNHYSIHTMMSFESKLTRALMEFVNVDGFLMEIIDSPNDISSYMAFADSLIEDGNPIGELIASCLHYQTADSNQRRKITMAAKKILQLPFINNITSIKYGEYPSNPYQDGWPGTYAGINTEDGTYYSYSKARDSRYWPTRDIPPKLASHSHHDEPFVVSNGLVVSNRHGEFSRDASIWPDEIKATFILGMFIKYQSDMVPKNISRIFRNLYPI